MLFMTHILLIMIRTIDMCVYIYAAYIIRYAIIKSLIRINNIAGVQSVAEPSILTR